MNNANVEVLNDVTQKLIDSCKGYQMCAEMTEDNPTLNRQFIQRKDQRSQLVGEFQEKLSQLGGNYVDSGTMTGSMHRGYTKFISVFRDNSSAALDALDDGEEHLAEHIQSQLKNENLSPDVSVLLNRAYSSAREGERFADLLDD